ncbi:hypothetical protein TNCV_4958791 [Trichonephila clavipes]|uniref:Uncharacterized protein n=1 Tax=Trichonephila clavipes TaxID=2585209 RepID=A0A8X6VMT2_TRICX|nr:hypothetical protein TNCV_4958791 [Trichonephila clavipes]
MELAKFKWEQNPPSSSQYMLLCDFHVLGSQKKYLKGMHFQLRRRTDGRCEGLCLVTATGIQGTGNSSAR